MRKKCGFETLDELWGEYIGILPFFMLIIGLFAMEMIL